MPNCGASWFATLTYKHVTSFETESVEFVILEVHLQEIVCLDLAPTHIDVAKIRHLPTFEVLRLVQHFTEAYFSNIAER